METKAAPVWAFCILCKRTHELMVHICQSCAGDVNEDRVAFGPTGEVLCKPCAEQRGVFDDVDGDDGGDAN